MPVGTVRVGTVPVGVVGILVLRRRLTVMLTLMLTVTVIRLRGVVGLFVRFHVSTVTVHLRFGIGSCQ